MVLDVALGDATTLQYLKNRLPFLKQVYGTDLSEAAVANGNHLGIHSIQADISDVDEALLRDKLGIVDSRVDWIIATEVLEHISEPERVLPTLLRLARRGVLVSVPNSGYYPFRFQLLMGRFPVQWDLWPGEHLRFWTYADFCWWLGELGVSGRAFVYFGLPILSRLWKNFFADGILWHLFPKKDLAVIESKT